ncbi:heterokaryon incompatibility protein-domain-containing protein [Xylaria sp. FL1777]|nr:heterokaryon incompatibility protein-domain-containing protein [Xylaria sp. FL1777]
MGRPDLIEWVRTAGPATLHAATSTGRVTGDPTQTPFFSTIWLPRKHGNEEPGSSQLRWMARQAQDRIQTEQEDRRLQQMLLQQQRQKRLRAGLDTLNGVLQDCKGRVDALISDISTDVPRSAAPGDERAFQQNFALMDRHASSTSSNYPAGGSSGTMRSDASAVASTNATGQSSSLVEATFVTPSLGGSARIVSCSGLSHVAQLPLQKIRLLRLLPSAGHVDHDTIDRDGTLNYSLEEFPCAGRPEYIALSASVRANLAEALLSIKESDPDAYLWADVICINQQDEQEKSSLVAHMGEIFANAKSAYAWLGPIENVTRDSLTGHLFTHLSTLGKLFWEHADPLDTVKLNERSLDHEMILLKSYSTLLRRFTYFAGEHDRFPTEEYTAFSSRAFWRRIWVLHEVFLANDLYYLCGDRRLASRHLTGALILLEMFQRELVRRDVVSLRIAMTNFCIKEFPGGSSATDPRDMIFGLLGLANNVERSYIRADYGKSVQETYVAVTCALICNGFTDVFAWAQPFETERIPNLPSWVPDYSTTIHESLCSQGQAKPWLPQFKASGRNSEYSDENAPPFDHLTLLVYGLRVDEVETVGW